MPSSTEPLAISAISPRDMVASGLCIGCGACVSQSAGRGHMRLDRYGQLKPAGDARWLRTRSAALAQTCPFSPAAANEDALAAERFAGTGRDDRLGHFAGAYVGHVSEPGFRDEGSSGGLTTWVAAQLLRRGLVDAVAHVAPGQGGDGPYFAYRISRSEAQLRAGAKSRYHPIELSGVIDEIRRVPGRYAIVGIPCFIKAVHLLRRQERVLAERIVHTLGLFCGHMKSARFVESFAWQLGTRIEEVVALDYRLKNPDRPANWYTAHLALKDGTTRSRDWWHLADGDWGAGFFMNSACNSCDDVMAETADIAFGDAWVEPYSSDGRGTNVVVVRSPLIHAMIETAIAEGRLALTPVDADFVAGTQAAGLRQRREGLAWRLTWPRRGIRPIKRVAPSRALGLRRKLIYLIRHQISAWSHRMFWLARATRQPQLYIGWARSALAIYQGFAYSRGRIGVLIERLGRPLGLHGRDG